MALICPKCGREIYPGTECDYCKNKDYQGIDSGVQKCPKCGREIYPGKECDFCKLAQGTEGIKEGLPDKSTFASLYAGQAPWDIGRPQKAFLDVADQITGSTLDAGCGTGDNALYFASRGHKVTGIDFLEEPILRAKRKAVKRGSSVTFLMKDALTLKDWSERFDSIIDCGLFHVFSDDDRKKYVAGLTTVLKPGGRLYLLCFRNEEPGTQGPRRISQKELHDAFAEGWGVESIQPSRFEVIPNLKDFTFSQGGPKAWFAVVRRG